MAAKRATTKRRPSYYRYSAEPKTATGSIPPWEDDGSSGNAEDVQRTRLDKTPHGHVPSTPYYGLKPHRVTGSVKKPQARSPRSVPGALQPRQTAKRPVPLPVQPFQERAPSPPVQPASPNLEQRVPYPRYAYIDPACDRACFIVASIIIGVLPIIIAIAYYFAVIFSGVEQLREQTISITSTTLTPKTTVPVIGTKDGGRNLSETAVKYICVHHVLGEGVRARGTTYGINLFPVENCQMVVYCCALLSSSLEPLPPPDQPDAFDRFVDRTKSTPTGLKPKLMIGDGFTYPLNYASLFDKPYLRRAFARVMTTWCVDHGYSGIFLRWPDANHQKQLLKLVRELGNGIQRGGLTLGTVFPQDADSLSQMHLDHLAPQKSCVLLEPPKYTWGNYRGGVYRYKYSI